MACQIFIWILLLNVLKILLLIQWFERIMFLLGGFYLIHKFIEFIYKPVNCHRIPSRCLSYKGVKFKICARCMAIYPMYLLYPISIFIVTDNLLWLFTSIFLMLPLIIDGYTQKFNWRKSNNFLRVITGILFGLGQVIFITFVFKLIVGFFE